MDNGPVELLGVGLDDLGVLAGGELDEGAAGEEAGGLDEGFDGGEPEGEGGRCVVSLLHGDVGELGLAVASRLGAGGVGVGVGEDAA